jgi:hypothetical protein
LRKKKMLLNLEYTFPFWKYRVLSTGQVKYVLISKYGT